MNPRDMELDLSRLDAELESLIGVGRSGRVTAVAGTVVRAAIPEVHLGERLRIDRVDGRTLEAEVIGFDHDEAVLMPFELMGHVRAGARVAPAGEASAIPSIDALSGRVVDALCRPLDGRAELRQAERKTTFSAAPHPLERERIHQPIATGIRAIDGCLTVGRGQRVGLFAAAGVGKSTLLAALARNVQADRVVLALIGERGCEVRGFVEDDLGAAGLPKATVVVSTSEQSALLRVRAAWTATAIAEAARARGEHVVLLVDSITRFARALRDIGLAAGEAPGRQGFPASVYAALPRLFERAGNAARGSITAFYTVLVAGDDLEEVIADETMSLLDGHIVLSRRIANRRYPAIDLLKSKSRVMRAVVAPEQVAAAAALEAALAEYEANQDKLAMGLFGNKQVEAEIVAAYKRAEAYLTQSTNAERADFDQSVTRLVREFGGRHG
ncbi:MAG: FliI/YscN family ATPase [Planctomycetes bacterium]|nr:FliI/YscN family ATPase [Planctomycetota bacterium]